MSDTGKTRIRLFASDLDNTLTGQDGKVSARTAEIINEVMRQGYLFTFATGRQASGMWKLRDDIPVNAPVICSNGGELVDVFTGQVYHRVPVATRAVKAFAAYCLENRVDFLCRADDYESVNETCVYLPVLKRRQEEARAAGREIQRIVIVHSPNDLSLEGEFVKLLAWPRNRLEQERLLAFCETLPEAWPTSSIPGLVELGPAGYDKGAGLRKLCGMLGVPLEETCVFGDYVNDLSMFEAAGMAVAMENGDRSVKEKATFVTGKNTENGVAEGILRILTGEFG